MKQDKLKNIRMEFERIKSMDYIESLRKGEKGAGITFNHNFKCRYPDVDIRVKEEQEKKRYLTIFNAPPEGGAPEITRLRNNYGYNPEDNNKVKILKDSVQANCSTMVGTRFLFKLQVDREKERLYLIITDKHYTLIEKKIYWSFELLQKRLKRKPKYLALVKSWGKKELDKDYYKYYDIDFYELKTFDEFLKLIEEGVIRITFRITIFTKGINKGQLNDKGTIFEIQELDTYKMYNKINI